MKRTLLGLVLAATVAGCGGSSKPPPVAKPPKLPRVLAQAWATQADAVAQALAARDGCTAQRHANELRTAVDQAAGEIPARLRAQLVAKVDALPGRITCNPPPQPPPPPAHHHGHGRDHHKHKGPGNGD